MSFLARPLGTDGVESVVIPSSPFPFSAFGYLLAAFLYVRCDGDEPGGSVLVETLFVVGLGGAGGGDA